MELELVGQVAEALSTRIDGTPQCLVMLALGSGSQLAFYCGVGAEPPHGARVRCVFDTSNGFELVRWTRVEQ